jgi:type II secretory ATPase GspE/PulE/Tfp pilus assembly ATPase PilB-like protein
MVRLEEELVRRGIVSAEQMDLLVEQARSAREQVFSLLLAREVAGEEDLLSVYGDVHGLKLVRLSEIGVERNAVRALSAKLVAHYRVVPVDLSGNVLTVAVSNPVDMSAVEDIEANLGYRVERVLATRGDIAAAVKKYYGVGADTVERILAVTDSSVAAEPVSESHDIGGVENDASVVKLVNTLLQDAITDRATDLHFETGREKIFVRRRIDGVLFDTNVPGNMRLLYPAIVSRIKLMAGVNIVERRMPQDGRARVTIGHNNYDLRISVVPAMHGEDVVIRILPSKMLFDLAQIGFSEEHLGMLADLIRRPHGIIFVTGPTGSGKSTTLYACLNRLNTRDRKIITIEDPVEYELEGVTQTQVRPGIGLTFAAALRSMLRHDPDVMMVGEVRDRETAEIAIQTAMTGHLVLSTLHTNDAAGGAVRLVDMGVDPFLVTSTVQAFIAQRLVRTLCEKCREGYVKDGGTLYRAKGCKVCSHTGYRGRVAICEFMPLVPEIQKLILGRASSVEIRAEADRQGMKRLRDDGWRRVEQGITSAEEVLRVTMM